MSSSSNQRRGEFGSSAENRVELALLTIRAIRVEVPKSFCVGVKIYTADFSDSKSFNDILCQLELIQKEQVDYSTLAEATMRTQRQPFRTEGFHRSWPSSTRRDAFFLRASQEIRNKFPGLVIFLTGGFRSRTATDTALDSGACSAAGIGRPAVKYPELPNSIVLNKEAHANQLGRFDVETAPSLGYIATKIRLVGAGAESKYWASRMKEIYSTVAGLLVEKMANPRHHTRSNSSVS